MKHKLMKRIIGLMTVVSMLGSGIPTGYSFHKTGIMITYANEVLEYNEGNSTYQYLINEDNTIRIIGYSGTDSEIEIPSSIDGKTVTLLGFDDSSDGYHSYYFNIPKFCDSLTLKKVVIPDTVTLIGYELFKNSINLKEVVIPDSVTSIYGYAFFGCQKIQEIAIPDSVIYLGDGIFGGCKNLKEFSFPNLLREIPSSTFSGCSALENVQLPNNLEKLGDSAFSNCALEKIEIPESVSAIGYNCFGNCKKLKRIIIPANVKVIEDYTFDNCSSLEEVFIPEGVTSIGQLAFNGCSSLKKLSLPNSITSIDYRAFSFCTIEQYTLNNGLLSISDNSFLISNYIEIPETVIFLGQQIFTFTQDKFPTIFFMCEADSLTADALSSVPEYPSYYPSVPDHRTLTAYYNPHNGDWDSVIEEYEPANMGWSEERIHWKKFQQTNNVFVGYDDGVLPDDFTIHKDAITSGSDSFGQLADAVVQAAEKESDTDVSEYPFEAYTVSLTDTSSQPLTPTQSVTVRLAIPEGCDYENCKVYLVEEGNNNKLSFQNMEAEYDGQKLLFETEQLGTYIVTEAALDQLNAASGDTDANGTTGIEDALLISRYDAGLTTLTDEQLFQSDVTGDGSVDIADALKIARFDAGLIESLTD